MPRRYHLIVGGGEVEALELTPEKLAKAISWTGGVEVVEIDPIDDRLRFVAINFPTSNDIMRATQGDYIIKDALGNLSVMGPEEFAATYELNEAEQDFSTRSEKGRSSVVETESFKLFDE